MRPPRPLHRAFQGDVGGRPQLGGTLGAETWRPPDQAGPTLREDGRLAADAAGGGPGDSAQMRPAARRRTGAASGGSALPSGSAGPRRELAGRPRPRGERDAGPTPSVQPLRARRPWGRPATGGAPGNGKRGMAAGLLGGLLHRQTGGRASGGPAASADGQPGSWGACRVGRRVGGESVNVP